MINLKSHKGHQNQCTYPEYFSVSGEIVFLSPLLNLSANWYNISSLSFHGFSQFSEYYF